MQAYILVKYIHYIAIFGIVATLVSQHLLIGDQLSRKEIRRFSIVDAVYGISAILVLSAGLTLWFAVSIQLFCVKSSIFDLKLGLFRLIGIRSIIPTVYFFKHRKGDPDEPVMVARYNVMLSRPELLFLFIIPLLATSMTQGIGRF